jgi:hypothetical protein
MDPQKTATAEIDIKEAVRRAKDFAISLFETEKISKLGLEAVERSDDDQYWLVTLGFSRPHLRAVLPRRTSSPIDEIFPRSAPQPKREYKVFRINAYSGEVVGVRLLEE